MATKTKKQSQQQENQKRTQRDLPETLTRNATFERESFDEKTRKVPVSFSSETDKVRFFGVPQILLHERSAVDFSTLNSVLHNHDPGQVIGRAENVRLDEAQRKGRGEVVFDDDPESMRIFRKIQSGSIRGASVGFHIDEWQIVEDGDSWVSPEGRTFKGPIDIATRWGASEFSVTPIPADGSVGVNRNGQREPTTKEANMPDEKDDTRGLTDTPEANEKCKGKGGKKREDELEVRDEKVVIMPKVESPEDAIKRERERTREVRGLCRTFKETADLEAAAIDEGWTPEQTRKACLEKIAKERPILGNEQRVQFGEDERDKFRTTAENWLTCRTNRRSLVKEADQIAARDVEAGTLMELARICCRRAGISTRGFGVDGVLDAALCKRAFSHSTSDFPNILSNVATKSLLAAYQEAPATWRPLVRVVTAGDFKDMYRMRLGDSGSLELTPELSPMPEGSFRENAEHYAINTYSKRFGISRQAIINDDLNAFDRIPGLMGIAAARLPGDLFYALLISASGVGPTMAEDALPLFSTTHTSGLNYNTGAFAISVADLGTAKMYMRMQRGLVATGETAPILNIVPQYLLVPAILETLALQMVTQVTPAASANVVPGWIPNLQVIVEPRLDAGTNGTTAWYLVATPSTVDGAEVAFLNGRDTPTMIRVDGTNILGVEWGVYLDVGVKFIDHRGWWRSAGA
jgi:HK97 family phage prohead protease